MEHRHNATASQRATHLFTAPAQVCLAHVIFFPKECNTRTSHEVTLPSTTLAQARLTAEF
ncbi:hypothetical protein AXF42_Ash006946 [Apostasia shenzhenica]|uniref:Uncharacterized protein n=1 Tax=Apostasia shenzhenica TaxID=1088818 RepID=A0A2I0BEM9_9ASPA|nr:hypothetical protein AXF42_Ash006946 [Apostasia shenzhenica]